ncbi:hypothetical protein ACDX78_14220 [Virgibacillus oceani]
MRISPRAVLFEFLSYFNDEEQAAFKKMLFERAYKKNQLLFTEGDPREKFFSWQAVM